MTVDRIVAGNSRVTVEVLTLYKTNLGDDFGVSSQQDLKAGGDGQKLHGWYALNTGATDAFDVNISNSGKLTIDCDNTNSIWHDATRTGPYVYKLVTGDFDIQIHFNTIPDENREIQCILVQSTTDLSDWVYIGEIFESAALRTKSGNTVDDVTTALNPLPGYPYVRMTRVGQIFTCYHSSDGISWTEFYQVTRADMPNQLRVGLAAWPYNTADNWVAQFDELAFEKSETKYVEVDVTQDVVGGSVTNVATNEIDSASVTLRDPGGSKDYATLIKERDILRVWTGKDHSHLVHRFTGPITGMPMNLNGSWRSLSLSAEDYSVLLNNRQVAEVFEKGDAFGGLPHLILKKLIDDHASDFTYNHVEDCSVVIDFIGWKYEPLFQAIQQLAEFVNWDWYVDVDKDIHFFDRKTKKSSVVLTTEMPDANIVKGSAAINPDSSQLENRVYVLGGKYLTEDTFDQRILADGKATEFFLSYKPYYDQEELTDKGKIVNGDIVITYDYEGTPVDKTVGIDGKARLKSEDATDGTDVLVNPEDKRLIFDRSFPFVPASGKIIRAQFKHYVPIIEALDDIDSINYYGGEPVGLFEGTVVNEQIEDRRMARLLGRKRLRKFARPYHRGSCRVFTDDINHGEVVTVQILELGINTDMLVRSVTRDFSASGPYTISVAFEEDVPY